jgi:signal peptidase II
VNATRLPPILPTGVAAIVIVLDQITKAAVTAALGLSQPSHSARALDPIVRLEYVENRGAAFGVLRDHGELLSLLALAVLVALVAYYRQAGVPSLAATLAVGLIAGGAIGNLIDRVRLGFVVDFVAIGWWPKFNLADSAITLGVSLLIVRVLLADSARSRSHESRPQAPSRPPTIPTTDG